MLWYRIQQLGVTGIRERIEHSLELAQHLVDRLQRASIDAWRNPNAITVVFPPPSPAVRGKWQLATAGSISHAIVLPNVTREQVDALADDLIADIQSKETTCEISG
jgi:histidine decarboxylase